MDVITYILARRYTDNQIAIAKAEISQIEFRVVSELPPVGESGIVYLLYIGDEQDPNLYEEYVWSDGQFLKLREATVSDLIIRGYYYAGVFWKEAAHINRIPDRIDKIYLDISSGFLYYYTSSLQAYSRLIALATSQVPGLLKLYDDTGENIDGTMTQRSITHKLRNKVELDTTLLDAECLGFELNKS